jgi:hypothetical protein
MTITAIHPSSTWRRPLVRAGASAGALAVGATVAVAAAASAANIDLEVDAKVIPLSAFAFWTIAATIVGVALAATVRTRRRFVAVTLVLTALSLVPSIVAPDTVAASVVLVLAHLVAAAIVIPSLAKRLPE